MDLLTLYVGYQLNIVSDHKVIDWACQSLLDSSQLESSELVELAGLTRFELARVNLLLNALLEREHPDFSLRSLDGELVGRRLFIQQGNQYLKGQLSAYSMFQIVEGIESAYDFPKWLDDLWKACDDALYPEGQKGAEEILRGEVIAVLEQLKRTS